jgi:methyl-accepting chemotaxis protein
MNMITNLKVGVRLGAAFAVSVVIMLGIVGVALSTSATQGAAATTLSRQQSLTRDVMQLKYLDADFNGWQTAYAFDIIRGLKGATSWRSSRAMRCLAPSAPV